MIGQPNKIHAPRAGTPYKTLADLAKNVQPGDVLLTGGATPKNMPGTWWRNAASNFIGSNKWKINMAVGNPEGYHVATVANAGKRLHELELIEPNNTIGVQGVPGKFFKNRPIQVLRPRLNPEEMASYVANLRQVAEANGAFADRALSPAYAGLRKSLGGNANPIVAEMYDGWGPLSAGLKDLFKPKVRSAAAVQADHAVHQTALKGLSDPAAREKILTKMHELAAGGKPLSPALKDEIRQFCSTLPATALPVGKSVVPGKLVKEIIPSDFARSSLYETVGHLTPRQMAKLRLSERLMKHGPLLTRAGVGLGLAGLVYGGSKLMSRKKEAASIGRAVPTGYRFEANPAWMGALPEDRQQQAHGYLQQVNDLLMQQQGQAYHNNPEFARLVAVMGRLGNGVPAPEPVKMGSAAAHAIELAGLGMLAKPSVDEYRDQPMSHKSKAIWELLGLGTLAAPSAYTLAKAVLPKLAAEKTAIISEAIIAGSMAHPKGRKFWGGVKDKILGGKADGKKDKQFNKKQLRSGQKEEREHTRNPQLAKEIAKDHLAQDKNYYKKLKKYVEKDAAEKCVEKGKKDAAAFIRMKMRGDGVEKTAVSPNWIRSRVLGAAKGLPPRWTSGLPFFRKGYDRFGEMAMKNELRASMGSMWQKSLDPMTALLTPNINVPQRTTAANAAKQVWNKTASKNVRDALFRAVKSSKPMLPSARNFLETRTGAMRAGAVARKAPVKPLIDIAKKVRGDSRQHLDTARATTKAMNKTGAEFSALRRYL